MERIKSYLSGNKFIFFIIIILFIVVFAFVFSIFRGKGTNIGTQKDKTIEVSTSISPVQEEIFPTTTPIKTLGKAKVAVPTGYTIVTLTEEERKAKDEKVAKLGAINPTKVIAKANQSPDAEELIDGETYSYPNPVFTWDGAIVKEQGVKIVGYKVYFGESHFAPDFLNEAKFQESNTYVAKNLEPGKVYYLMVRVVTDSKTPDLIEGYDVGGGRRPVRPLFTYYFL